MWSHLPSTERFLVLFCVWNRTIGDLSAKGVTPELVCYLPILTTFGWDGGSRVHTRLSGLRQGTTVCVHMRMDMEQLSDRKLMMPSGMALLVCGAGSRPSCHLGVPGGRCQRV